MYNLTDQNKWIAYGGSYPGSLAAWFRLKVNIYVVVQFYLWFKFYFPLFLGMVMCDNEFKTKENII